MRKKNKLRDKEQFERAVKESYSRRVGLCRDFKSRLDIMVDNAISSEKSGRSLSEKKTVFVKKLKTPILFAGLRWQLVILLVFLGILSISSLTYASVYEFREAVSNVITVSKGTLNVKTDPLGAEVLIRREGDGNFESIGFSPIEYDLKAGDYELKIIKEKYKEFNTKFTIRQGEGKPFDFTLERYFQVLEDVNEWKSLNDIGNGFEMKYPSSWKLLDVLGSDFNGSEYKNNGIEVRGENSKIRVYRFSSDILDNYDLEEILYKDKVFYGIRDYNNWEYVLIGQKESQDSENKIRLIFFTNFEEEFEIYEFIKESLVLSSPDIVEDDEEIIGDEVGSSFSFIIPTKDWYYEREGTDNNPMYYVFSSSYSDRVLHIYQAFTYPNILNNYSFSETENINGYIVKKFISSSQVVRVYSFPQNVFVEVNPTLFESVDQTIINSIVNSIKILDSKRFEDLSDFSKGYSMTIPSEWTLETNEENPWFDNIKHSIIKDGENEFQGRIFKWEDIKNDWNRFIETFDEKSISTEESHIRVGESLYKRLEVWETKEKAKKLLCILYVRDGEINEITQWDPRLKVGGDELVFLVTGNFAYDSNLKEDQLINRFDLLVTSLRAVDF